MYANQYQSMGDNSWMARSLWRAGRGGLRGLIALHTYYVVRIEEVCFSDRYLVLFAAPAGL